MMASMPLPIWQLMLTYGSLRRSALQSRFLSWVSIFSTMAPWIVQQLYRVIANCEIQGFHVHGIVCDAGSLLNINKIYSKFFHTQNSIHLAVGG